MISRIVVVVSILAALCSAAEVTLINYCEQDINPGFYPGVIHDGDLTGGFLLPSGDSDTVVLPPPWAGRIWGRTACDDYGSCETGGCPGGINCTGPAPAGPTLAQFNIDSDNADYFNPSTVDGFNIGLLIIPGYGCDTQAAGCSDLEEGDGCDQTSECPTGVDYEVIFCYE